MAQHLGLPPLIISQPPQKVSPEIIEIIRGLGEPGTPGYESRYWACCNMISMELYGNRMNELNSCIDVIEKEASGPLKINTELCSLHSECNYMYSVINGVIDDHR
jgi:hypothetical protein